MVRLIPEDNVVVSVGSIILAFGVSSIIGILN